MYMILQQVLYFLSYSNLKLIKGLFEHPVFEQTHSSYPLVTFIIFNPNSHKSAETFSKKVPTGDWTIALAYL